MPVCKDCLEDLPKSVFASIIQHGKRYYRCCKPCWNKRYRHSIRRRASMAVSNARGRARAKKITFEITNEWAYERFKKGVCELSGVPLTLVGTKEQRSPCTPSIERINPALGYTKDNCRVIATCLNYLFNEWGEAQALHVVLHYIEKRKVTLGDNQPT